MFLLPTLLFLFFVISSPFSLFVMIYLFSHFCTYLYIDYIICYIFSIKFLILSLLDRSSSLPCFPVISAHFPVFVVIRLIFAFIYIIFLIIFSPLSSSSSLFFSFSSSSIFSFPLLFNILPTATFTQTSRDATVHHRPQHIPPLTNFTLISPAAKVTCPRSTCTSLINIHGASRSRWKIIRRWKKTAK